MQPTRPACRQCRARRVKCDRLAARCGHCTRLQLNCSFSNDPTSPSGRSSQQQQQQGALGGSDVDPDSPELTQAGFKRRRIRRACGPCRSVKAKCSGGEVCSRCMSRGIECVSRADGDTSSQSPQQQSHLPEMGGTWTHDVAGAGLPTPSLALGSLSMDAPPDESQRHLIRAYFERADSMVCNILHASTVLADWSSKRLDMSLQKAICASGLHFLDSSDTARKTAASWMDQSQRPILMYLDDFSFARLQALVLVLSFRLSAGQVTRVWNLLSLAARLAFTLGLNRERPGLDPVQQESRRRTMWAIYSLDRRLCGGLEDLSVCPVSRMTKIRLPCEDRTFERGMPSRAQFLGDVEAVGTIHGEDMDIAAHIVRIYTIRDNILRYTKRVVGEDADPCLTEDRFAALEKELDNFAASLPPDIQLSPGRLELMAHSRDAPAYFMLHTIWLQGYCDLYRFLIPGVKEAVGRDVIEATRADFVLHCQTQCLRRAIEMVDMWRSISHFLDAGSVEDNFFGVCIYQTSQMLHHLGHMLDQIPGGREGLKSGLHAMLRLASPVQYTRFSRIGACLREVDKLINEDRLGRAGLPSEHGTEGPSEKDSHRHLASRETLIPQDLSDSEDRVPAARCIEPRPQLSQANAGLPMPLQMANDGSYMMDPASNLTDMSFDGSSMLYPSRDSLAPWDSFDILADAPPDSQLGGLWLHF